MFKKIFIGNLKIHDITDSVCPFSVKSPIQGLESAEVSTSMFNKSGVDGVYVTNQFKRGRRITLTGDLVTDTSANLVTYRRQLLSALTPNKTNTTLSDKVLYLTTLDDEEYRINIQVLKSQAPISNITKAEYFIDIIATDNNIQGETLHTETIQTRTGGGHVVPYVLPVVFAGGSGGSAIINNAGDAESCPVLKLYGPLTNPRIENRTTGKWLSLTLTIEDGSYVEIDMENRTIIQGDQTNRIGTKSDDSKFWPLEAGDNEIIFTSSISGELGYCEVIYRDQWNGI